MLATTTSAHDLKTSVAKRAGMSQQRLARINTHRQHLLDAGMMVCGFGMVSRNGKIVRKQTYGLSDRKSGNPMTEDVIFRIYSMTKPITGVALNAVLGGSIPSLRSCGQIPAGAGQFLTGGTHRQRQCHALSR